MKVLDLFSGIGGFSLALEKLGHKTVAFCEKDKFCQKILKKHWPTIPILSDISTLLPRGSHASRFQLPAEDKAKAMNNTFGLSSYELLAVLDRDWSYWKTSQTCAPLIPGERLDEYSQTWPRSGMTRNGIAYRLPTLAHLTREIESGLFPTPLADAEKMGWGNLSHHVKTIPTPTVNGNYNRKGASKTSGDGLATFVKTFPAPHANCHTGIGHPSSKQGAPNLQTVVGGQLNPTWVEWLMGYPEGYTDLER